MLKIIKNGDPSHINKQKIDSADLFEAECLWCGGIIQFNHDEIRHNPYNDAYYTKCPCCSKVKGSYAEIYEWRWHRVTQDSES